jgi:hypothetical protein
MELRLEVENVKCRGCARSIEKGSVEGMKAAAATAKSFVRCAIGRLSD